MRRKTSAPTPPSVSSPENEPSGNGGRIFLMILLGVGSLLVILQATGLFKTLDGKKTSAWVDFNSAEYQNREAPEPRVQKPQPQVEATLREIASEFEGKIFSDIRTANEQKGWGLSDDEAQYFDAMRQHYASAGGNWLNLVKKSYSTYKTVKEAFGETPDAAEMLKDAQRAMGFYNRLNQIYGIPTTESHNFAQSGEGQSVSDWAIFAESNKRR